MPTLPAKTNTKKAEAQATAGISKKSSKHAKAGVTLSVARLAKMLRRANVAERVSNRAPVYITGGVEELLKSLLRNARAAARDNKAKRVNVTDIIAAVRSDPDLARLYADYTFGSTAPARKAVAYCLTAPKQKVRKEKLKENEAKRKLEKAKRDQEKAEAANALVND
jgi:histone H3/H4